MDCDPYTHHLSFRCNLSGIWASEGLVYVIIAMVIPLEIPFVWVTPPLPPYYPLRVLPSHPSMLFTVLLCHLSSCPFPPIILALLKVRQIKYFALTNFLANIIIILSVSASPSPSLTCLHHCLCHHVHSKACSGSRSEILSSQTEFGHPRDSSEFLLVCTVGSINPLPRPYHLTQFLLSHPLPTLAYLTLSLTILLRLTLKLEPACRPTVAVTCSLAQP